MKRCLNCNARFKSSILDCPSCGWVPKINEGFYMYAPEYCHSDVGFKDGYFSDLFREEERSFWFRARNQIIIWALKKYSPDLSSFLEVGCGTGYVLSGIRDSFPCAALYGSEIFVSGLRFSAERLEAANLMQMDARNIPYHEEFDVIGAFDVLEHIKEDGQVLEQIYNALKIKGIFLVTVPQHKWLWSSVDEHACHVRRYSADDLHNKITAAGFHIIRSTSFVSILLPAMMLSRYFQRKNISESSDASPEFHISSWMNYTFLKLLELEQAVIKYGIDLPIGGSRLVVAKKIQD